MSGRPRKSTITKKNRLHAKVNNLFSSFNDKKFQDDLEKIGNTTHDTGPKKRKMKNYIAGKGARRTSRLEILVSCGLWPKNKQIPANPLPSDPVMVAWEDFIKNSTDEGWEQTVSRLQVFLMEFNPLFLSWNEEFQLDYFNGIESIRKYFYIPYISLFEAQLVTELCCTTIGNMVDDIREENPFHQHNGIEVLFLLNILTRTDDNCIMFPVEKILTSITALMKWILLGYKIPFEYDIKGNSEEDNDIQQLVSQIMLANCFQIILNFVSPYGIWGKTFQPLDEQDDLFNIIFKAKEQLFQLGILNIIKGYIAHMSGIASRGYISGSQIDFRLIILNVFGATVDHFPDCNLTLLQSGALDTLIGWIGWPDGYAEDCHTSALTNPSIRNEFRLQLLCLQIFICSGRYCPQILQRISMHGGWTLVQQFILWSTEIFSINPQIECQEQQTKATWTAASYVPKNEEVDDISFDTSPSCYGYTEFSNAVAYAPLALPQFQEPFTPTKELDLIFSLLKSLCESNISQFGHELDAPELPDLGTRIVVEILCSLFVKRSTSRNSYHIIRIRDKIGAHFQELQRHVLTLISQCFSFSSNVHLLCERFAFWEIVLFSSYFGGPGLPRTTPSNKQEISRNSNGSFAVLRTFIYAFITYVGGNRMNTPLYICQQLLEYIRVSASNMERVHYALQTVVVMLKYNLPNTQHALVRLNALPILAMIAQEQQTIAGVFYNINNIEHRIPFSRHMFLRSRFTVLSTINHFLSENNETKLYAIRDSRMVNILFSMLFEPDMRKYALRQIINLLGTDVEFTSSSSGSKESCEQLTLLYQKYLALFERAQRGSLPTHFCLLLCLVDAMSEIISIYPLAKKLLATNHCFDLLLTLLRNEKPKRFSALFLSVFGAIKHLIRKREPNKTQLQRTFGFATLKHFIITGLHSASDTSSYCDSLLDLLFSILIDGEWKELEHSKQIQYPAFLLFIVDIILEFPPIFKRKLLHYFLELVSHNSLNQSICCREFVIFHLLNIIPHMGRDVELLSNAFSLIEILGTHSITVKELKRLFLLLKSQPGNFRPFVQIRLMKTLQFMALSVRKSGPSTFFDLDGKNSALVIPPLEKWPPISGYTFCFWFCIASMDHMDASAPSGSFPRLISFLDADGYGLELYIRPSQDNINNEKANTFHIEVSVVSTNGKLVSHCFTTIHLRTEKWYLLLLTHKNPNRKFKLRDSEMKVFINSSSEEKVIFKYPQFPPTLNKLRVGANVEMDGPGRVIKKANYLHGQLGSIFLFDESITTTQAKFLQEIFYGSDFSGTSCFGELEAKIRLYYNCNARVGKSFLDLSPQTTGGQSMDAKMIGKLHVYGTRNIKDIIHCIGGIKVLLPLFAQLDQPEVPIGDAIDYNVDKRILLQSLALLGDMLTRSPTNQQEMARCKGFRVIGFLIEQSSPKHLTSEVLLMLEDLSKKISANALIRDECWKHVIFRWSMWVYAPTSVQWEVANLLLTICTTYPMKAKTSFSVQEMLDTLYFCYWFDERGSIGLIGKDIVRHPITDEVVGTRPSNNELGPIRKCFFAAMKMLMKDGPTTNDVIAICSVVVETSDVQQLVEFLSFIYELLEVDKIPNFADVLLEVSNTDLFMMLASPQLQCKDEDIKVLSLLIIAHLIGVKKEKDAHADLILIPPIIKTLTYRLYQTLLSISVCNRDIDPALIDETSIIQRPHFILIILELGVHCETILQKQIMQGIYLLLVTVPLNIQHIIQIPGWHEHLFRFLTRKNESRNEIEEMVINIFKICLSYVVETDKNAFTVFSDIFTNVLLLDAQNQLVKEKILSSILSKVFSSFRFSTDFRDFPKTKESHLALHMSNLIHLVVFSEEFMFYTPLADEISILQHQLSSVGSPDGSGSGSGGKGSADIGDKDLYSPFKCVTFSSMHGVDSEVWDDVVLGAAVMKTCYAVGLLDSSMQNYADQFLSKDLQKNQNPRSHFNAIILRIALQTLRYGNIKQCGEIAPMVKKMIKSDSSGSNKLNRFVLAYLIVTLKQKVIDQEKSLVLIDIIREFIPNHFLAHFPSQFTDKQLLHLGICSVSEFHTNLSTPQWAVPLKWANHFLRSELSSVDTTLIPMIDKRRIKHVTSYVQRQHKHEASQQRERDRIPILFQNVHRELLQPEINRKRELCRQRNEENLEIRRIWKTLLRSLTNERAPWAANDEGKMYWKLDKNENISRMRIKMKRNYKWDLHVGAARDTHSSPASTSDDFEPFHSTKTLGSGIHMLSAQVLDELEKPGEEEGDHDETMQQDLQQQPEKVIFETYCELIVPLNIIAGHLEITTRKLHFKEMSDTKSDDNHAEPDTQQLSSLEKRVTKLGESLKEITIPLHEVKEILLRRYLLRSSALEIFLTTGKSHFLNFSKRIRNKAFQKILSLKSALTHLTFAQQGTPKDWLKKSDLTRKWQLRLISNFDYLMELNSIAGRSYNDITQYPVFPWVLKDYKSDTLHLADPKIYRDLSKPVGALEPERLAQFVLRYENFMDDLIPQFHYGSHYSSSGIVLFYLIRMEPFTSQFIQLQGGKFDHADRMFDSIPNCWTNVLTNQSDVKELIPEFFYQPSFLSNKNRVVFGNLQDSSPMDHVGLPPWASTPEEFIHLHREALESEYVSLHLHEWIDLIFGYKQVGQAAIDAHNVFYYLTYEGAVDLDSIQDEGERKAIESQIDNFGQTPAQLLTRNHPKRLAFHESHQNIFTRMRHHLKPQVYPVHVAVTADSIAYLMLPASYFLQSYKEDIDPTIADVLVTITRTRFVGIHKFAVAGHIFNTSTSNQRYSVSGNVPSLHINPSSFQTPFTMTTDPSLHPNNFSTRRQIGAPFATDTIVGPHCFATTKDSSLILSCGHWDASIKCSWLDHSRPLQSLTAHKDIVVCLSLSRDGTIFVTGSKDTTILVWEIFYQKGTPYRVEEVPLHILYGHNDDVLSVYVDSTLDIVVSGSRDGTCIIHNMREGTYLRSICHPQQLPIHIVKGSNDGDIVFASKDDLLLTAYSINGDCFASTTTHDVVNDIFISRDSKYVVTGGQSGILTIYLLHTLEAIQTIPLEDPIISISICPDEVALIVALSTGTISIVVVEEHANTPLY